MSNEEGKVTPRGVKRSDVTEVLAPRKKSATRKKRKKSVRQSFAEARPDLVKYWAEDINGCSAADVGHKSSRLMWFRCDKGHETLKDVATVTRRETFHCEVCFRENDSFAARRPDLLEYWASDLNDLDPEIVRPQSNLKAFFRCKKGHVSERRICTVARAEKYRCDRCVLEAVSVKSARPDLVKHWVTEDSGLGPDEVTINSSREVTWRCGCDKQVEFKRAVNVMASREEFHCDVCGPYSAPFEQSFAEERPDLVEFWAQDLNPASPEQVSCRSSTTAFFRCSSGHVLERRVADVARTKTYNCETCSSQDDSISARRPDLVQYWDTENNKLSPDEVTYGSKRIVSWRCDRGHTFMLEVRLMTARKEFKCDVCSATLYGHNPEMFDLYWDAEKNNPVDPRDYENCRKNLRRGDLHWKCPEGHEFQGSVERMLKNLDDEPCPVCKKGPTVEPAEALSALDPDLVNSLCPIRNRRFGDISDLSVKSDMRLYWDFGGGNIKRLTVQDAIEVFAEVKKNRKRRAKKQAQQ